jgi:hypothetical protein
VARHHAAITPAARFSAAWIGDSEAAMFNTPTMLRGALLVDAVVSGTTGLLLVAGAGLLGGLLGLPHDLLRYAGLSLLPFAAVVAWVATRDTLSRAGIQGVIAANALWVVASIALLFSGQVSPNTLGIAFVLIQAVAVAALADVQFFGLRKTAA